MVCHSQIFDDVLLVNYDVLCYGDNYLSPQDNVETTSITLIQLQLMSVTHRETRIQ